MQLEILSNETLTHYTFLAWQEHKDDPVKINPMLLKLLGVTNSPNSERYIDVVIFLSDTDHHKTFGLKMVHLKKDTARIDLVVPKEITRPVIQSLRAKCGSIQSSITIGDSLKVNDDVIITEPTDPRLKEMYEKYIFTEITATEYRERAKLLLKK